MDFYRQTSVFNTDQINQLKMGNTCSNAGEAQKIKFSMIPDRHSTIDDVHRALRKAKVEAANLIFAIDLTSSNNDTGKLTFNNTSLHKIEERRPNPYQQIMKFACKTLEPFDEDRLIPAYGFGDFLTKHRKVFNLNPHGQPCQGFDQVLKAYNATIPYVQLSGPTSFAPIIRHSMEIVRQTGTYHILFILTDGEVNDGGETENAIVEASALPLSIVVVGVGDGPFDLMEEYDDKLPQRECDNLQFVNYQKVLAKAMRNEVDVEVQFAVDAMQEIPEHYAHLHKHDKLVRPGYDIGKFNSQWELKVSNDNIRQAFDKSLQAPASSSTNSTAEGTIAAKEDICGVCLDRQSNTVIDHCGHTMCNHKDCIASAQGNCPFCRQKITKLIQIFHST
jgi:E3 ubiquitin-protein ligase RGLG